MYKAYNSIMDVYEDFAPVHRKRIKDAVEQLPRPFENEHWPIIRLRLICFSMGQTHSRIPRKCYRATVLFRKPSEMATIRERMERQRKESEQEIE